ncbi:hypothetical protein HDU92_002406 [Lobulomyces angularis]|nr:hypothetical protein HDU92_002406 [Lobulomyces angularis]
MDESIDFILNCSKMLKLSHETVATALIYQHKTIDKLKEIDKMMLALTNLQLACKQTEQPRKLRDYLNVAWFLIFDGKHLEIGDKYFKLRDSICSLELIILRVLDFNIYYQTSFPRGVQIFEWYSSVKLNRGGCVVLFCSYNNIIFFLFRNGNPKIALVWNNKAKGVSPMQILLIMKKTSLLGIGSKYSFYLDLSPCFSIPVSNTSS